MSHKITGKPVLAPVASLLDKLLGPTDQAPKCRALAKDISCHWWPTDAKEGDLCFCGESRLPKETI